MPGPAVMPGFMSYRLALWLLLPVVLARLWYRGISEPGYRQNRGERFGIYRLPRPVQPILWLHAVSLGETRAATGLVRLLLQSYPGHVLLFTTMTATGHAAASELFGSEDRVQIRWLPYDYRFAVRRFLGFFQPQIGILMETEMWPQLLHECGRNGIPMVLANARLSERSARRYALFPDLARQILHNFFVIAAQSVADAERFRALGAGHVTVTGNMKFDVAASEHPATAELRQCLAGRRIVLAASLREGEERLIMDAWRKASLPPDALLVMVPRHPQRFPEVARLLLEYDPELVCRSNGRPVHSTCRVFLGDSMGEMGAYYACSHSAFVGGSLLPYGGQNLIEACAAGVPTMFGPHTYNFEQAADLALAEGAAVRVACAEQVFETASVLLADAARHRKMSAAALAFTRRHRGATVSTLALCRELLADRKLSPVRPAGG